jgi:hypothetical protein
VIKTLKLSDKTVSKFKTHKEWNYSTTSSETSIILEQGNNIPIFTGIDSKLSTEQNDSYFNVKIKKGKNIKGTFFEKDSKYFDPEKEPLNTDGSYQRSVYNSVKHLFYNEYGLSSDVSYNKYYKNPMYMFGSETGIYTSDDFTSKITKTTKNTNEERRVVGDEITVLEIPAKVFGEKIKPNSIKITDNSSKYESIVIEDDGNTNLIVGQSSFNEISEINLNSVNIVIDENTSDENKMYFDYSDITFGSSLASHDKYFISGSPVLPTSPSDMQSGRATLYKYISENSKFEILKNFYCPFTQSGLAQEQQNDNTGFILTEIGNIISNGTTTPNDNFGKALDLGWGICAIGSPQSSIAGVDNEFATGHVFIYDKGKGGIDNWGLINVLEGDPGSSFGNSISLFKNYLIVGSPTLNNGVGGVYIYKKTKRTKSHPWIKTSTIYESYEWNDLIKRYKGIPEQDNDEYLNYLKLRSQIVSDKIKKHRDFLNRKLKTGEINEKEYYEYLPVNDDFSQKYPFNYLYSDGVECDNIDSELWFKKRYWSPNTHPSVRCKSADKENFYNKSIWPGYITDESDGSYVPNPNHVQNKQNKWAYRWKVQNVSGNNEPIILMTNSKQSCDLDGVGLFGGDDDISSFGDKSKFPINEYSETPDSGLGDYTFDLIGMITPPTSRVKNFGEVVKIIDDTIYVSNPSSDLPRCYVYNKVENEYGCEEWKLTHSLSDSEISGHSISPSDLSENMNFLSINYYDTFIELEICPSTDEYTEWLYKLDSRLIKTNKDESSNRIIGGTRVSKCDSMCRGGGVYSYYSRYNFIGGKEVGQLPHNYGISKVISDLFKDGDDTMKFFSKSKNEISYSKNSGEPNKEPISISWKNVRENISFIFPNVESGIHPSFMSIYSNNAKIKNGKYDPRYMLAEIGAHETLNGKIVRMIFNSGKGNSEEFIDFVFKGSVEGTHYIVDELTDDLKFECGLPANIGEYVDLSDILFNDPLKNKANSKFYSKGLTSLAYLEPFKSNDTIAISWKNFRENVSFSYPDVKHGMNPSFMTIYFDDAKQADGKYDPIYTIAEICATDTLNGNLVRLTLNTGNVNGNEHYYEFEYRGSVEGTHFTLSELKKSFKYACILPPNYGTSISAAELLGEPYAKFFSKGETSLSYMEPFKSNDTIAISWKNFRENVSFSYPDVKSGSKPSFMTIYSDNSKNADGLYDPKYIIAEIGASNTLDGEKVCLTLNVGQFGGDEMEYEFIYNGSIEGTHYTLGELKENISENYGELPANIGVNRKVKFDTNQQIYIGCSFPMFFSKRQSAFSYTHPNATDDEIALSWKNVRENVSFQYPRVKSGTNPSFMTIYSEEGKQEDGGYNPSFTLAEIGASDSLNGKSCRLVFNQTECDTKKRFYYEFNFNGSIEGTHFTLGELNAVKKNDKLVKPKKINEITSVVTTKPEYKKSHYTTKENTGEFVDIGDSLVDDFLNNKEGAKLYTHPPMTQNLGDVLQVRCEGIRENTVFTYPSVEYTDGLSIMSIYANNATHEYEDEYKLCEIHGTTNLNGQVTRLTFNYKSDTENYYEFIYDGSFEGTKYKLSELETKISDNLNIPLSIYSPETKTCKIKIPRNDLKEGFHKVYVALVNEQNIPVGLESSIEFYNNPSYFDILPRHLTVDKSYRYSYDVKSEFGYSIDATKDHLIIGNPSDRKFYPISNQKSKYQSGAVYVFNLSNKTISFKSKLYGNEDIEENFNFRYGTDVSILNNNFIVSGHNTECSEIKLVDYGDDKKITIDNFIYGSDKYDDTEFSTMEYIFQNYEYDYDSKIGDVVLRIKVDDLSIDKTKLPEINVKADFIDTGESTLRVKKIKKRNAEKLGGLFEKIQNPIGINHGCEITDKTNFEIYRNKDGWSIFYDELRGRWVISDKIGTTTDLYKSGSLKSLLEEYELSNNIDQFEIITESELNKLSNCYLLKNTDVLKKWKSFQIERDTYQSKTRLLDLILEIEDKHQFESSEEKLNKFFNLYVRHSSRLVDSNLYLKYTENPELVTSLIPLLMELEKVDKIFINFRILKIILELYIDKSEIETLSSWYDYYGYKNLIKNILEDVHPSPNDHLSLLNLNLIFKIKNIEDENLREEWKNNIGKGFILSDLLKHLESNIDITFSISDEDSPKNLPSQFNNGVGFLKGENIELISNNDTVSKNGSLTWGIYRDYTKIIGEYLYVYVNILPNVQMTDTLMLIYSSRKTAINGIAYYYEIANNECSLIKRISSNKGKYEARKQFGNSVSLSSDFIFVGSPVLGNFQIDELITFAGTSVVPFGASGRLFLEHKDINPKYLRELSNSISGSVVSYDHHALQSTKKYYLGNAFYKNGLLSISDQQNHFSDILKNSGTRGFDIEFKSTQTLYENEILCRVEPNEFNFSTNPTSLLSGGIVYDINEDGKFDINDLSLIYRYIMDFDLYEVRDERVEEELNYGLTINENKTELSKLLMTETEDLLLMDTISERLNPSNNYNQEYILDKLDMLYTNGEFDIDGDGIVSANDARLLVRYFMGRTGSSLTNGLVDGFGSATRFKPSDIENYLNEKTGKNIGRKILKDFIDYKENDQRDTQGSYLAPYATTIGLYSGLDLIMVAKLGKPVKILPNYPINFLIKYDS